MADAGALKKIEDEAREEMKAAVEFAIGGAVSGGLRRSTRTFMPETGDSGTDICTGGARSTGGRDAARIRACAFLRDVAEARDAVQGIVRVGGRVWVGARAGYTDFGGGVYRDGLGAAMTGLRPVVDIMFGDFLTLTMDQLVNQAAKVHYMSGGTWKVPMVLRTTLGATRRSAAQHSQSLHAWLLPCAGG